MENLSLNGGASIGWANATWPFAKMDVTSNRLELNTYLLGNFIFQPTDIIAIVPYSGASLFQNGIKIIHSVENYNRKIVFRTSEDANLLISKIKDLGFLGDPKNYKLIYNQEIIERQNIGSFPLNKTFAIAVVVIWNVLLLPDFISNVISPKDGLVLFPNGPLFASGFIFLISTSILVLSPIQAIALKPGKTIKDIDRFLYFIILISTLMFIAFLSFKNFS